MINITVNGTKEVRANDASGIKTFVETFESAGNWIESFTMKAADGREWGSKDPVNAGADLCICADQI